MNSTIIYNGTIINEGHSFKGYLIFDDRGIIRRVCHGTPANEIIANCTDSFDAGGCIVIPGVIDDQVHFRDPGLTHKGDIATESQAAAARGREVSAVNYAFFIGATNDNLDTLLKTDFTRCPGVKLFLGSSTGNMLVDNEKVLNRIFARVPAVIAVHSEDEATICANRERISAEHPYGVPIALHPEIRSREACILSTGKAIRRARKYGSRLHVLHVSTAEEAAMFSNRPLADKRITAEVSVHHLWFCYRNFRSSNGAVFSPGDA